MKKLKSILMLIAATLLLTVIFCFNASAAEWHDRGDIQYSFDEDTGVMVIRGEGAEVSSGDFGVWCRYHYTDECVHNDENNYYWDYEQYDSFEDYIMSEWSPEAAKAYFDSQKTKTLIIEEGVASLEPCAFYDFANLEVVILPQSITEIPNGAFYRLKKLQTVVLSNSTTSIGDAAFYGCYKLKNLFVPYSVKSIGESAFLGCNQNSIRIPETVEEMGERMFAPDAELRVDKESHLSVTLACASKDHFDHLSSGREFYIYNKKTGKYTKIGEAGGYFTYDKLEEGKTYDIVSRIFIEADTQRVYSDYSNIVTVVGTIFGPEKPTDIKITPSTTSVHIQWKDNSEYARIYKYIESTGKFVKLLSIDHLNHRDDPHSAVIRNLKPGTTYAFLIRTREVDYDYTWMTWEYRWSHYTEKDIVYVSTLPEKATGITATQTTSSIKLSWKEVPGATGYRVYSYDKTTGKYTNLGTVQKLNGTIKNLKPGTTYGYLVRPYRKLSNGDVYWAEYSKDDIFYTSTKSEAPTLKATAGTKKFTLSWNKVAGATSYEIWYSTSKNGTYKKHTTVSGTSYSKSSTTGKTYYFKVRAIKTVNGQTIKGEASTAKGVKIK